MPLHLVPAAVIPGSRDCISVPCQPLNREHIHAGIQEIGDVGALDAVSRDPFDASKLQAPTENVPEALTIQLVQGHLTSAAHRAEQLGASLGHCESLHQILEGC